MHVLTAPDAVWVVTQVFPSWSVTVPRSLVVVDPVSAKDEGYWHARDEHRSVSMTSMLLDDSTTKAPVPASLIFDQVAEHLLPAGRPIDAGPDGLRCRAVFRSVPESDVASHALQGIVVADGVVLLATITSDDEAWCGRVWASIRWHALPRDQAVRSRRSPSSRS